MLKKLRRRFFPTNEELYEDGCNHARETIKRMGVHAAGDYLWEAPRDGSNHFDRGIIDYFNRYNQSQQWKL